MQWSTGRHNPSSIARYRGIDPGVIDVAVENFNPQSRMRESNRVVVPSCLGERCNYNYVLAHALEPSMKSNDAVLIVHMECVHMLPAPSRLIPPQPDKI